MAMYSMHRLFLLTLSMTNRRKALAAIVTCVLFWGFSFISIKIAVEYVPPMSLGALRFGMALVLLFFIKRKIAPEEKIRKKDIPLLAGAGLTGVTFYFFFENNGVSLIPASEASIIIGSIPVITMIAEMVGGKKTSLHKYLLPGAGAFISLAGVALVAGVSFALTGAAKGYFFMAGACVSWVCYCFLTRPLFARCSRIYIVFWQSVIGFIGFLPFAFIEFLNTDTFNTAFGETFNAASIYSHLPQAYIWAHVIFLGVCCSALGYWFYSLALKDLGVGVSSLFINFIPVISAVGGFIILGERLQPLQWLGAILVLAGVYLAMAAGKSAPSENSP